MLERMGVVDRHGKVGLDFGGEEGEACGRLSNE
jgi:hypothetical protein